MYRGTDYTAHEQTTLKLPWWRRLQCRLSLHVEDVSACRCQYCGLRRIDWPW